jgi:hypothetical protein
MMLMNLSQQKGMRLIDLKLSAASATNNGFIVIVLSKPNDVLIASKRSDRSMIHQDSVNSVTALRERFDELSWPRSAVQHTYTDCYYCVVFWLISASLASEMSSHAKLLLNTMKCPTDWKLTRHPLHCCSSISAFKKTCYGLFKIIYIVSYHSSKAFLLCMCAWINTI